jgi:hypothetical protein
MSLFVEVSQLMKQNTTVVLIMFQVADANGTAIFSDTKPYTWSEVSAEKALLQTEYDNNQYQRDRASAYPSLQDQLDMKYWDSVNGTNTWEDKIAAVKTTYPKS